MAVAGVQVPVMGEENEREITREELKRTLNLRHLRFSKAVWPRL